MGQHHRDIYRRNQRDHGQLSVGYPRTGTRTGKDPVILSITLQTEHRSLIPAPELRLPGHAAGEIPINPSEFTFRDKYGADNVRYPLFQSKQMRSFYFHYAAQFGERLQPHHDARCLYAGPDNRRNGRGLSGLYAIGGIPER